MSQFKLSELNDFLKYYDSGAEHSELTMLSWAWIVGVLCLSMIGYLSKEWFLNVESQANFIQELQVYLSSTDFNSSVLMAECIKYIASWLLDIAVILYLIKSLLGRGEVSPANTVGRQLASAGKLKEERVPSCPTTA